MKNWAFYRVLLGFLPAEGRVNASDFAPVLTAQTEKILRRHRCVGATLCAFDQTGVTGVLSFGRVSPGENAAAGTVYRVASVSKLVTALAAMKLAEGGALRLDADVNAVLPFPLRHPGAPHQKITLRMLLSHTAGIHDGDVYNTGIGTGMGLSEILQGDSFCAHLPGEKWEYSNLGAGIAGVVMEAATQTNFEELMRRALFNPLKMTATYYPQLLAKEAVLANAYRILPPQKAPAFDAQKRRARPLPAPGIDSESHYALAHGNLCVSALELCKAGAAALFPGFLTEESLGEMRRVITPFGARARNLSQGIGTFILNEPAVSSHLVYGHQSMAYGAAHGLFFDPAAGRGLAVLTAGCSEARRGVLADLNQALLALFFGGRHG